MGWLATVGGIMGIRAQRQTAAADPRRFASLFPTRWIPTDLRITTEQALNVSVVYACIRAIAEALASSPWQVYGIDGRRRELLPDDPLAYLLNQRPNPEITAAAFREALIYSALADGNGYAEIQRDGSDRPAFLWPLDSTRMRPLRSKETGALAYEYLDEDGIARILPARDVFHVRGPVSVSALMGDSVVGRASRSVALMSAAQRFGLSFLANGAQPSGVLTYPGKLDEKSMNRMRNQVAERQSGAGKAGKPLLLEGGMKFEPIQADPSKAMMHDTLIWSVEDTARYFGVPLVLLNVQAAAQGYGSNLSTLFLTWSKIGLRPWVNRLEQEANDKLFPIRQRGTWRESAISLDWLVRGDAKEQAEADEIRIRSGVDSINQVLERLGRNSIGAEGDIRFVPGDIQPLTPALLEIQRKEAEPDPAPRPAPRAVPDPAADATGDDPEDIAACALEVIAAALSRYGARFRARARDLEASKAEDPEGNLTALREQIRNAAGPELAAALRLSRRWATAEQVRAAFDAVEAGADVRAVAADLGGRS